MKELHTHLHWSEAIQSLQASGEDYVLVTQLGTRGSTPRPTGTKMVFARDGSYGSIGGGHLELRAAQIAAEMLGTEGQRIEYLPLGPTLGQCCGGSTSLLFESFAGTALDVALFGAGHVGRTLAPLLQQMPCRLYWFDSREHFSEAPDSGTGAAHFSDDPSAEVANLPAGTWYLIMTHNHQQDYAILKAALKRADAGYVGLIGSLTKWRRFRMRLEHEGFSPAAWEQVHCPIGLDTIPGKRPVEVAVSVAGQIINLYQQQVATPAAGPDAKALQPVREALAGPEAPHE
ncbi:xanthine dehydrogenase accessory protein XdhC [Parahaliea maris]|uniref:Xanthine dehydrogenase accessory protein XdhC n=1 Tax=Parahaliea maris TaxID=2716870 RepID=A0A5C9A5G0_9GAMM|nr:xanthine dehydrogenase accessory protein XdhC [Parahaliea maris]TXS95319.1 xanthine dehydrogenase accessory protein XdhC [Parahaliea maris]